MKLYRLCCKKCKKQIGTYVLNTEKVYAQNLILPFLLEGGQPYEEHIITELEQDGIEFSLTCFKCGEK